MRKMMKAGMRCIAPIALVALLFSGPTLAAEKAALPASSAPSPAIPALTAAAPAAPAKPARETLMMVFGFLGLLLFSASAGGPRSRRSFEVRYRSFPYGSSFERRRAERKAA